MAVSGKDLDFKILKEDWNVYELTDGGILKVRFVLLKVIRTKTFNPDGEPNYAFVSHNFIAPRPPSNLMGPPTTPPPTQEQIETSDKVEVDFKEKTERWNEYLVEDGTKLRIKLVVTKVERSGFFDQMGYPIYGVSTHIVTRVSAPKALRKKQPKGRRV